MKLWSTILILFFVLANPIDTSSIFSQQNKDLRPKDLNTVVVMGMIHSHHKKPGPYDLENLKQLIRDIKPDYVLAEIPPDRLAEATRQFNESGKITESRVRVFPEYTDALFPLTKEMSFEIIPCAAWTKKMNDHRREVLTQLQSSHAKEYSEMEMAQAQATMNIKSLGNRFDPVTIHMDTYDAFVKAGMRPYDHHFNEAIGDGGWTNINAAHYKLIENALDKHSGKGKRFLITFGSWHKYYIQEQLKNRNDIKQVSMSDYLEKNQIRQWPRFRLNSSGNNSYGSTEIQQPVVKWKLSTGDIIESSCAVVDGTVFVGGHAKRLHAIDQVTGKLKWKFDVGGWVRATPSVVDGVVYFGADDNKFYAVDAVSGKSKWEFELGEGGEQSSPTVLDGVVYFGAFDNYVYALDAATGKQIWKFDAGASMLSSPCVTDDAVYIATYAGKLFAINRKTGNEIWMFQQNDTPIFSSPVTNGSILFFTSYDQHIYAVNTANGAIVWKFKTEGQIFSSPTIIGNTLYVGSNDSHLYAIESNTGKLVWKTNLNGAVFSSPSVSDHSIYVGSSDGNLYSLDREKGNIRWRYTVKSGVKVWTSPVATQGVIYFGSHAGDVIALMEKPSTAK